MPAAIEARLLRLEAEQDDFSKSLHELNTTLALLNQTVGVMAENEKTKQAMYNKGLLFVMFAFGASFIAWIIRGGLA